MLSERGLRTWLKGQWLNSNAHNALQWMNAKITSGELMVVKTIEWDEFGNKCKGCGFGNDGNYIGTKYCPGCGAKIANQ